MRSRIPENINVVCFDADDTLWLNEPYFRRRAERFISLLSEYGDDNELSDEMFSTEKNNLKLYGYGVKAFTLSMIETALRVSSGRIESQIIEEIIGMGKEILSMPVVLMEGAEEVLSALGGRYRLILATKGDLLDQETKLEKSGLAGYFHHIEIMSDKREEDYLKLLRHLDISPEEFLMAGNSMKSDILPVYSIGGTAVYIPAEETWQHEIVEDYTESERIIELGSISEILPLLI